MVRGANGGDGRIVMEAIVSGGIEVVGVVRVVVVVG